MLLNKSSIGILNYLINMDAHETVYQISKQTGQSRRKIYYHIDRINAALPAGVEPLEALPRIGICLTAEQKEACKLLLEEITPYNYVLTSEERYRLMILLICISSERLTIDSLTELTEVSRSSVIHDLASVRELLEMEQYQMTLVTNKHQGYQIKCHPLNKVQYLYALLTDIYTNGKEGFIQVFEKKMNHFLAGEMLMSSELKEFLLNQVQDTEKDLGKKINFKEVHFMLKVLPFLLMAYRNMDMDKSGSVYQSLLSDFDKIQKRFEYRTASRLADALMDAFDLQLDQVEISIIAVLLLSFRKDRDLHVHSADFEEVRLALELFLKEFEQTSTFEVENRDDLLRNLITHCKALLFRKQYGILSKNPLSKHIASKYPELLAATKSCLPVLERAWQISFTKDEVAYLAIHMGGAIKDRMKYARQEHKVCLVCDEGVGVQRILLKQCQELFPPDTIVAVFNTEQFISVEELLEIRLVLTTNEGFQSRFESLQIHPILTAEDRIKIRHMSHFELDPHIKSEFTKDLEKLLTGYMEDDDRRQILQLEIERLIDQKLLQ